MLLDTIKVDMNSALKKGDAARVSALRFLVAAVNNSAIQMYGREAESKLTDEDVMSVIKKQVKTHRESIEAFATAGRQELVEKEKAELSVLEIFLPAEVTDEKLKEMLAPVVASGETNFGLLMKQAMTAVKGAADGGRVSALLKGMLASKM